MCNHKKIIAVPTSENSWGIADTYNIKCFYCGKILYENRSYDEVKKYIHNIDNGTHN